MSTKNRPTSRIANTRSLLRWYPDRWRDRYGDEFIAMIEDDLAGRPPSVRYRLSIARSGLNERLRDAGLIGDSVSPSDQLRSAALSILCAFALFIVAGVGFAKISEHWDQSIYKRPAHLPVISFNSEAILAGVCSVAGGLAAVALLPTFIRFIREGGWPTITRQVAWAVAATSASAAVGGGLVVWAQHLTTHQRNTGLGWYQLLFIIVATLFGATVATWSAVAVAATRCLTIAARQLHVAAVLAILVAACMPLMTAAAAVWWASIATSAPWFLAGAPVGSSSSPWDINLLVVLIAMTAASGVGVIGVLRVISSWHVLRTT